MKVLRYLIFPAFFVFLLYLGYHLIFPDVSKLKRENPKKTSFMEYREKQWKEKKKKLRIVKTWIPLSRVSQYAVKAVIVAEDDKFWSHKGFDVEAMQKALERDLKEGKLKFGGSTISQQLAKNLYLTPSKNPLRKVREAILTWRIERTLSKRRILELYLNVAEWGEGIFGIEAASRHYFGKAAIDLDPGESALLAASLPNPYRYRPDGPSRYVQKRAKFIYDIMVKRGIVIQEYDELIKNQEGLSPDSVREAY